MPIFNKLCISSFKKSNCYFNTLYQIRTMNPANEYIVTRNEADFRFEVQTEGDIAYVDYRWSGEILLLLYIFVPVSFRGKGISSVLLEHVMNYATEKKVKIKVFCPYIAKYIRMHPEHQGLLANNE